MTYGALVVQLVQDYEDYAAVNAALARMGASIGQRLVEDFLARSALGRCADFKETGEVVAKVRLYFYFCICICMLFLGLGRRWHALYPNKPFRNDIQPF